LCDTGYASLTAIVGIAEAWPAEEGLAPTGAEVASHPVPGAPFDPVHRVADHRDSRTLHSRERD
jgi:hypothetical protein